MNAIRCLILSASLALAAHADFPGAAGNYGGLIQTADANFLTAGALTILLEDSGQFTAKLTWEGDKYSFKGHFDPTAATFTRDFAKLGETGTTLALALLLDAGNRAVTGTLDEKIGGSSTLTANLSLSGAPPDTAAGNAYAGTTSTTFINPPGYGNTPQAILGDGFTIVRVGQSAHRPGRFVGRLPDAEPYSGGSVLRGTDFTLYSSLYRKLNRAGGLAFGQVSAADLASLNSVILWAKRAGADPKYYDQGFATGFGIVGQAYPGDIPGGIPPIGIQPGPVAATITFADGNLGEYNPGNPVTFTAPIRINAFRVKVFTPNVYQVQLTTDAAAATFEGTFVHPISGKLTPFRGGFKSASGNTPGEGRGSFKGSLAPGDTDPAHFRMSGSVRITVD